MKRPLFLYNINYQAMIQRIQTVYLLIVTALLITAMCLPVGIFTGINGSVSEFMNQGVFMEAEPGSDSSPWGMFAILLLSAIISLATIFLYKNRMLQIRMTVFNTIILIGYYLTFIVFMLVLQQRLEASYHLSWGLCLPLIAIILNYLAIRAIGKDEVLVKAADRLR